MQINKYLTEFREYMTLEGLKKETIRHYVYEARRFLNYLSKYYPRIRLMEMVTKDIIFDYRLYLKEAKTKKNRPFANGTIIRSLNCLKKFFQYLVKYDYLLTDPSSVIEFPKRTEGLKRNILSEDEVAGLLKSIQPVTPVDIRNRAILELGYACGLRTTELCTLLIEDVNLDQQDLFIRHGKGDKSRTVPIGKYATYFIKLYLEKSRKKLLKNRKDTNHLFLTNSGIPFDANSLSYTLTPVINKKLNTKKHITFYSFRHSLASHLLANKMDVAYIAKLLGHSTLNTTQAYLHHDISDLKKMHALHHPRECKNLEE